MLPRPCICKLKPGNRPAMTHFFLFGSSEQNLWSIIISFAQRWEALSEIQTDVHFPRNDKTRIELSGGKRQQQGGFVWESGWHLPQSVDTMNTTVAMAHIRPGAPTPAGLDRWERYTLPKFRWCWISFKGSLSLLGYCILFACISTSLGHSIKCEVWFLSLTLNGIRSLVTAIKSPRVVLLLGAGWGGNDGQPLWKMTV